MPGATTWCVFVVCVRIHPLGVPSGVTFCDWLLEKLLSRLFDDQTTTHVIHAKYVTHMLHPPHIHTSNGKRGTKERELPSFGSLLVLVSVQL